MKESLGHVVHKLLHPEERTYWFQCSEEEDYEAQSRARKSILRFISWQATDAQNCFARINFSTDHFDTLYTIAFRLQNSTASLKVINRYADADNPVLELQETFFLPQYPHMRYRSFIGWHTGEHRPISVQLKRAFTINEPDEEEDDGVYTIESLLFPHVPESADEIKRLLCVTERPAYHFFLSGDREKISLNVSESGTYVYQYTGIFTPDMEHEKEMFHTWTRMPRRRYLPPGDHPLFTYSSVPQPTT